MKCSEAARILNAVQLGGRDSLDPAVGPSDLALLEGLASAGHLAAHDAGARPDGSLAGLKNDLSALRSEFDAGRVPRPDYESRERALRTQILDLTEKAAVATGGVVLGGRRYVLTYKGRSLLGAIAARLGRVDDLDLVELERQLEGLRASLNERARRAAEIYRLLRSSLGPIDAVTLRNAAVGLAARAEPPEHLAAAYQAALVNLMGAAPSQAAGPLMPVAVPPARAALVAEVLVVGAPYLSADHIASQASEFLRLHASIIAYFPGAVPYQGGREDAAEAAAMLVTIEPGKREAALQGGIAFRHAISQAGGPAPYAIAPWILLGCTGLAFAQGAGDWVMQMRHQLLERRCPPEEAEMATSIMGASRGEAGGELLFQFDTARAYLGRLSEDSFVVPAAMLAAIPTSIAETLDDLRMASAAATANGLSEGGTETLSLGVKLLIQTAVIGSTAGRNYNVGPAPPEALSPLGLAGLSLILPTALVAVYAFHEVSLHQAVVEAQAFHPVHTHYIYG